MQLPLGSQPALPEALAALRHPGRPFVVNFANAQCPCTEFNLEHLRKMQKTFRGQADFVLVLESSAAQAGAAAEFRSMHLDMPVYYDPAGQASGNLGVYGTPQAALLDAGGRLYFRGNYNRSRYCTDESSEYVRIALDALVGNRALPSFPPQATITYGCPLPRRFAFESGNRGAVERERP